MLVFLILHTHTHTHELRTNNKKQATNYEEPVSVINFSNKDITVHQISQLSRGLKYTPTPKENIEELRNDIKHFIRKVKLLEYFQQSISLSQENPSTVKSKGNFIPPRNRDNAFDLFSDFLTKFPDEELTKPCNKHKNKHHKEQIEYLKRIKGKQRRYV